MATFLTDSAIGTAIEKIFEDANSELTIISPFIKLHSRLIDKIKSKSDKHKLLVKVVFGKNEDNYSKSLGIDDFQILSQLPNVEIRYEPRLHAKYYANEYQSILSSMNLYEYSLNNNIEFGVLLDLDGVKNIATSLISDLDGKADKYFDTVIKNSKLLFKKVPQYKSGDFMGITKKFMESSVEIDELSNHYGIRVEKITEIPKSEMKDTKMGYCICTAEEIPFNPKMPMSEKAYKSWKRFGDEEYSEKYCHFSGEKSDGETSFSRPILKKNWKEAKKYF